MRLPIFATILLGAGLLVIQAADAAKERNLAGNEKRAKAAASAFNNINVQQFDKLRSDSKNVVLDVRTPKEFAAGHVPGAINIDVNSPDFEKKVSTLDTNKSYLVHCGSGVRSVKACNKLGQLNFGSLYNLEGGLKAWEKAGNKGER